ncbi:MAG: polysaccharide deacetylase family protein [Acidimicrobiales bacterium]
MLARHRARATFFVIGEQAAAHPELVAAVAAAGHEVAHHTWSHRSLLGRPPAEVAAEVERTGKAIGRAGVEPRRLLRPPRGQQDEVAAESVCRAGIGTIGWSANLERHLDDPEALASQVEPGAIILVHDGQGDRTRSIEALDRFLTVLDRRAVRAVGVEELLAARAACSPSHGTTGCER